MIAHFERTEAELIRASIAYATQTPPGRRRSARQRYILTSIQFVLGLILGVLIDVVFPGPWWRILSIGFGVGTFQWAILAANPARPVRREVKMHLKDPNIRKMLGPVWIGITPDGLVSRTPDTEVLRRWPAILGVHDTPEYIVLEVAEGFLAIPATAFASEEERTGFRSALEARGALDAGSNGSWYRSKDSVDAQQTLGRRDSS